MKMKCMIIIIFFLLIGASIVPSSTVNIKENNIVPINEEKSTSVPFIDWWPMYRHDPFHTGFSNSTVPNISNQIRFEPIGNVGKSSPSVVNNRIYIGCLDSNFYCFNCSDGDMIWFFQTNGPIDSSPAVYQNRVFFGSYDGNIYCLNATTGNLIWNYSTSSGQTFSAPVYDNHNIYIAMRKKMFCFNASTGSLHWSYYDTELIHTSPAVYQNLVYFASNTGYLRALNKENGSQAWAYKIGTVCHSSPTIAYGRLYIGSDGRKLRCFNATTGALIWDYQVGWWVFSTPAVADGKVYFGSCDNNIYCVDAIGNSDGTTNLIWNYTTGHWIWASPAVADNQVFFTSYDGNLYCLNASSGVKLWNYTMAKHPSSSPAVVNGKLYVGGDKRGLYSFGWGNVPPNPASDPYPRNGVMRDFGNLNLSWVGLDRNPLDIVTYDIYLGTSNPPPLYVSNYSNVTYYFEGYEKNITYYWKIVTWDNYGESCEGPLWEFTTGYMFNECLDTNNLTFSSGGYGSWFGQKDFFYYDGDALQSDDISNNQFIWLKSTVNGPGVLSFYWNVSSEEGYDFLNFLIDGVVQCSISGNGQWEQRQYNISEGFHELQWNYSTDMYTLKNLNCGWIDRVEWINGTPTTPDRPFGPTGLIIGEQGIYETQSTEPYGRDIQYRFDWDANGSNDYSNWTAFYPSGQTINLSHSWTSNNSYVIKVQARNIYGFTSNWSEGLCVNVTYNHQPNPPILTGPAKGKINIALDYNFTTTDPDGDKLSYYIDWGDDTNSGWIGPYQSGDVITQTHIWSNKGDYIIKAKAKDVYGYESDWGQLSVTMPYSNEQPQFRILEWLLERLPNAFPIFRFLMDFT